MSGNAVKAWPLDVNIPLQAVQSYVLPKHKKYTRIVDLDIIKQSIADVNVTLCGQLAGIVSRRLKVSGLQA